jgi:trigger factor
MKTTVSQEGPTKVRISIDAALDELSTAEDRAFHKLADEVKVPGFRKGKVPRKVLEARLDPGQIREATLQEAIPELWRQAIVESEFKPLTVPDIEVRSFDDAGLSFDALFEIRPEIHIPDVSTISVERPSSAVTDEEVEEQLLRLQERFATLETVARPARRGDYALIDLKGYVHDTEVAEASATDLLYEIGTERFVPELDTELEGKRQGDILKFNATLPATYPGEFAGKEIAFQVLVKETRQKNLPALDDEFAKTASEFDTLDELRADLRKRIEEIKRMSADAEVRNRLLEKVVSEAGVAVPEALVNDEMSFRLSRFSEQIRRAGVTLDQYLERTGQTEEQIEADLRAQAERNVAAQLLLEEVGVRESLEASEEELEQEILGHAQALQQDPAELRKQLASGGRLGALTADIIRRKALDLMVERADIKEESQPAQSA